MTLISGASSYINAATLSNIRGSSAQTPSLLGDATISLLDVGRGTRVQGIGLSSRARALTQKLLNSTSSLGNSLLSAPAEANSIENLQTKINALRATTPKSQLSRALAGEAETESTSFEDNPFVEVTRANRGNNVNTTA